MKLNIPEDSTNSLTAKAILDVIIAFSQNDLEKLYTSFTDDVTWEFVGHVTYKGLDEIKSFIEQKRLGITEVITLDYIITHGNFATAGGKITEVERYIHFADFYELSLDTPTKIKKIKSFEMTEHRTS